MKKYNIRLNSEERDSLVKLISGGRGPARMFTRARVLLKADQGSRGPAWQDDKISDAFDITVQTVEQIRKQFVEEGLDAVLSRHEYKQKVSRKKIDGKVEAHLIALSCSEPPQGRARWTLRILADSIVELGYIDSISYEAIRQTLKKSKLNHG